MFVNLMSCDELSPLFQNQRHIISQYDTLQKAS